MSTAAPLSQPARSPLVRPAAARPLLKWAGGKRQLLAAFRPFFPARFDAYREPFVGSGAVFFDLHATGRLSGRAVVLSDSNPDLIGCYRAVREDPAAVVAALERLANRHARRGPACYYAVRDAFNRVRRRLAPEVRSTAYTPALAAMLIYLNRTGYNGLFRVNGAGAYNVPAGRYARPRILDAALVYAVAGALAAPGVELASGGFAEAVKGARAGDFLYFDPPYVPLSATSAFGAYTAIRFDLADQERLCETVVDLARRGACVMLSNSSAPAIDAMYREAVRAGAGLALWAILARRAINARPRGRGPIRELLLTNAVPGTAGALPEAVRQIA